MDSKFILDALRKHHSTAAIVHEVVLNDYLWEERDGESRPFRRIDALMFDSFQRTAIEIKVSKADWKRDTFQKRAPWANIVHRFVYAVPKSLADEVGGMYGTYGLSIHGCGVWTVDERGKVEVYKKATVKHYPESLPQQVVQALAYRAAGKEE